MNHIGNGAKPHQPKPKSLFIFTSHRFGPFFNHHSFDSILITSTNQTNNPQVFNFTVNGSLFTSHFNKSIAFFYLKKLFDAFRRTR